VLLALVAARASAEQGIRVPQRVPLVRRWVTGLRQHAATRRLDGELAVEHCEAAWVALAMEVCGLASST
jgi:hypothetical protein